MKFIVNIFSETLLSYPNFGFIIAVLVLYILLSYVIVSDNPFALFRGKQTSRVTPVLVEPTPETDENVLSLGHSFNSSNDSLFPPASQIASAADDGTISSSPNTPLTQPPWETGIRNLARYLFSKTNKEHHILKNWINSLNDISVLEYMGYSVLRISELHASSKRPRFTNLRCFREQSAIITVSSHLEAKRLAFSGSYRSNNSEFNLLLAVEKLQAELIFTISYDQGKIQRVTCRFMGNPLMQIALEEPPLELDSYQQEIVERFTRIFRDAVIEVFPDQVDLPDHVVANFQSVFGHLKDTIEDESDNFRNAKSSITATPRMRHKDKRLLVKVIKANGLQPWQGLECNPFCLIALDSPRQEHKTNSIASTSPFWDEHFLFDLNARSRTLTFSIFDRDQKSGEDFMGRCRISLFDLKKNTCSRQVLPLVGVSSKPSMPSMNESSITLELMLMAPQLNRKSAGDAQVPSSVTNGELVSTAQPSNEAPPNDNSQTLTKEEPFQSTSDVAANNGELKPNGTQTNKLLLNVNNAQEADDLTLKKKSRTRSLSPDRSRSRKFGATKTLKNWFGKRDRSETRANPLDQPLFVKLQPKDHQGSTSTLGRSETSSIGSQGSFICYDTSTLVFENLSNPDKPKYYLVSKDLAKSGKHGCRGTKLHIYNDHVFTATHFTKSEPCDVCNKVISKRLGVGKQGYKCRDCDFIAHKSCHYKTDVLCPSSSVHQMEMEYVGDPPVIIQQSVQPLPPA